MINYSNIIQSKYLAFFTSKEAKTYLTPNAVMTEFLNDMTEISDNMCSDISPTQVILQIFENNQHLFEHNKDLRGFHKIERIANSNALHALSELEIFTLLWYCSCKNVIAYQEAYYVDMTMNGVIGKLLNAFSQFHLSHVAPIQD